MRTYVGFALAIAVLFIASPVEGGKKPRCDAMDYSSENVDCSSCTYLGVLIDPPTATYKKKTICTCACYYGCVRDSGKAVRECDIRPRRWKPSPRLQCSCRPCAEPTPPLNYESSNCTGTKPFGTICTFVCPAGYYGPADDPSLADPPEQNMQHYCKDSNWNLHGNVEDGCKRDGEWSAWDAECSCGGGGGTLSRTRTCNNPAPDGGGLECLQSDGMTRALTETETITCPEVPCPTGEVSTVMPTVDGP